jgi:hypothetical protein
MEVTFLLIQQIPINELVEILLYAAGAAFSLILVSLSISAYTKSDMKKLKYAIGAFCLFSGFLIYESLELIFSVDNPITDIIIPSTSLAILVLFFMAVTKKSNQQVNHNLQ